MKKESKKEWLIKYAKNNGLDEILNEKYRTKTPFVKKYSSEIQAICSILSVLVIGIVTLFLSIQSNKIAEMQLAVSKAEVKPIVNFSYQKEVSSGIDRITVNNAGTTPLSYDVEVISFFNIMANENSMGSIPIRVYTLNNVYSHNSIDDNLEKLSEIDIYSGKSEFVAKIESGVNDIKSNYTTLYWDVVHTYVVKVTCLDSLNETSEFYYMYDRWGGNVLSLKKGKEIFQEYDCMIPTEDIGHYTSKEAYFDFQDTTPEAIFKYALKKIREKGLYSKSFPENEFVKYGDYEP